MWLYPPSWQSKSAFSASSFHVSPADSLSATWGSYSGKVLIFPQIHDLPLMGLDELKEKLPQVAEKLSAGDTWNDEAEKALFDSQLGG